MTRPLAERVGRLGTESAFEVLRRARALEAEGRDVIHLEIGQPDAPTPGPVVEVAVEALRGGAHGYVPTLGLPELRAAVAADASARRGIEVDPADVVICPGGKPVMSFVFLALVEPGDEVLLPDPGFPIYRSMVEFCGATAVGVPLRAANGFRADPDEVASLVTERTKLLVLNSPNNPTGGVSTDDDLAALAALARDHDLWVLSDEIYSRLQFDAPFRSIVAEEAMAERTVLLDGHSKTYAMTGWRLGHAVAPAVLVPHLERLLVNTVSCTPPFTQLAGVEALTGDQSPTERMLATYRRRRDLVVDGLSGIDGITCHPPGGAFYAFPDITGTGLDDVTFADRLLADAGVATLAGSGFGPHGAGHLRLSLAASDADLTEALDRLAAFVAGLSAH
ncbi:MAG: pyridoxal phosphate-dependent aminotransferase [Actinomycetota bacterium]